MSETNKEHLYRVLKDFDTAMLITRASTGELRARPMAMAKTEPDADLWFATPLDSAKVDEIQRDSHINVAFQGRDKFVSISGRAEVVKDRAKIDELWNEMWKVWFPEGKDDPNLALLRVEATKGEYWDNAGTNKFKFLFDTAKAYLTGQRSDENTEQNQKVEL